MNIKFQSMNLYSNPSLRDLDLLIDRYVNSRTIYDLLVTYNGDVMMKPNDSKHPVRPGSYKFYFMGLHGKNYLGIIPEKNLINLIQLYKNLIYCWENDLRGAVDFNEITSILEINYWLEMNNISQGSKKVSISLLHYPLRRRHSKIK